MELLSETFSDLYGINEDIWRIGDSLIPDKKETEPPRSTYFDYLRGTIDNETGLITPAAPDPNRPPDRVSIAYNEIGNLPDYFASDQATDPDPGRYQGFLEDLWAIAPEDPLSQGYEAAGKQLPDDMRAIWQVGSDPLQGAMTEEYVPEHEPGAYQTFLDNLWRVGSTVENMNSASEGTRYGSKYELPTEIQEAAQIASQAYAKPKSGLLGYQIEDDLTNHEFQVYKRRDADNNWEIHLAVRGTASLVDVIDSDRTILMGSGDTSHYMRLQDLYDSVKDRFGEDAHYRASGHSLGGHSVAVLANENPELEQATAFNPGGSPISNMNQDYLAEIYGNNRVTTVITEGDVVSSSVIPHSNDLHVLPGQPTIHVLGNHSIDNFTTTDAGRELHGKITDSGYNANPIMTQMDDYTDEQIYKKNKDFDIGGFSALAHEMRSSGVQVKEADLVKDALGRTPTLGYKEGDFDMGINEGPSGFHSVYANVTEDSLMRVRNPTNPGETILVPGPGAKVYIESGVMYTYTEQGEKMKIGGFGASQEDMFNSLKQAANYGKGPTVFYDGSSMPPVKAVTMVRSYGGQGFDWIDVSSKDSWIGALTGLDKQGDMRWYTGELSEQGYVGNGLINPFAQTIGKTNQLDDFNEVGASFLEIGIDVVTQAIELTFAFPEMVEANAGMMTHQALNKAQGHVMKNNSADPFTLVTNLTSAGAAARHHDWSEGDQYFHNVRRPWSSDQPFEGTVNESIIGEDERMAPALLELSKDYEKLKTSAQNLNLDAEEMRKLAEWDPKNWTDLNERQLGEYIKRSEPEYENLASLLNSTTILQNLDQSAQEQHAYQVSGQLNAMNKNLIPEINDDQHVVRHPGWTYEDQGHEVPNEIVNYVSNVGRKFVGRAFDVDNPADADENSVPTWYIDDGKAELYKHQVDALAKTVLEDMIHRQTTADQLQYNYDTDSLNWLSGRTQTFVDVIAPESAFKNLYTPGLNKNYHQEFDTYQREMYESFKTKEGWHHTNAEDMSKADQFYWEKYGEDTEPSYVPQDYWADKTGTNMYTRMKEAETTIMAGEEYQAPAAPEHPQGIFEMPEKTSAP